ncbi:MAG: hypothetical protein HC888_14245, partial [Candidatus Competibacteraceae bacterium]|nr:hypothetical protein [Candidatus Competibacteraceae bacterium]
MEPVAITLTLDGKYALVTEGAWDDLYIFPVNPDGTLDDQNSQRLDVGFDPSPVWVKNDSSRGYFMTQQEDDQSGTVVATTQVN